MFADHDRKRQDHDRKLARANARITRWKQILVAVFVLSILINVGVMLALVKLAEHCSCK
jgi:hypothetical protein